MEPGPDRPSGEIPSSWTSSRNARAYGLPAVSRLIRCQSTCSRSAREIACSRVESQACSPSTHILATRTPVALDVGVSDHRALVVDVALGRKAP